MNWMNTMNQINWFNNNQIRIQDKHADDSMPMMMR